MARILVADDARVMRMLLRTWFERLGHVVVEAADGPAALAALREGVDIAFCDVNMPGMTGLQILDATRGDPRLARVPICLVTTLGHEADVRRGLQRGAASYLTKPVAFADVNAALQRLLPSSP